MQDGNSESKLTEASRPQISSAPTASDREAFGVTRLQSMGDGEEGECEGQAREKVGENIDGDKH